MNPWLADVANGSCWPTLHFSLKKLGPYSWIFANSSVLMGVTNETLC